MECFTEKLTCPLYSWRRKRCWEEVLFWGTASKEQRVSLPTTPPPKVEGARLFPSKENGAVSSQTRKASPAGKLHTRVARLKGGKLIKGVDSWSFPDKAGIKAYRVQG